MPLMGQFYCYLSVGVVWAKKRPKLVGFGH